MASCISLPADKFYMHMQVAGKDYEEEMRRINEKYNKGEEEQQGGGSEVKKRTIWSADHISH